MATPAIYIRWSTDDQGHGTTLQVQTEACMAYCDREGMYVPEDMVLIDDGYSGGNMHRPGLAKLRQLVKDGQVDTVVVYRMDRLSRDLADATGLVGKEWKGRAVVRSATEDVRPEADEGWLNYSFRAAFADYERRVIKQRTYAGKVKRVQEGYKVVGTAPYGYRHTSKPGFFDINEEQAEVVRAIFYKCARENLGIIPLSRWLNQMGYKPSRAAFWGPATVRLMLRNPAYKGYVQFGRQKFLKTSKEEPGPWRQLQTPSILVPAAAGSLPPIVPDDIWEQAQVTLSTRHNWMKQSSGRSLGSVHLLTGLLFCRCGGRLSVKRRPEPRQDAYRCVDNEQRLPCPHRPAYIQVRLLDVVVVEQLMERINSREVREGLEDAVAGKVRGEMQSLMQRHIDIEYEMHRVEGQFDFIDGEYRNQRLTIEEVRRVRSQAEAERTSLLSKLAVVDTALLDQQRELREREAIAAQVELIEQWDKLTPQQRRQVLRQFIHRIEVLRSRETGEISLHIQWAFDTDTHGQEMVIEAPKRNPFKYRPEEKQSHT